MSGKRSFDIGSARSKKTSRTASRKPAPKKREVRKSPAKRKSLRERREAEQGRNQLLVLFGIVVVCASVLYLFWRPEVRIAEIHADTREDPTEVSALVEDTLDGRTQYVLPKDSIFFFPEEEVEQALLTAYPRIKEVQISRDGFTAISVETLNRESAFVWCGTPEDTLTSCFETDDTGVIFKEYFQVGSSTQLLVHAYIDTASTTDSYPLRARVIGYEHLPAVLTFIQTIEALGTPIPEASIRGDEIDLFAESGTRITYVLGNEERAQKDARASLPSLNLMDGSISYVDLRFPGKVYVKRTE